MLAFFVSFLLVANISVWVDSNQERTISGKLTDKNSGETLIAANILIKNTFRGTITNDQGEFEIRVIDLPVTLVFRYIGYESKEITIEEISEPLHVQMIPVTIELEPLVFTGEDPAIHIMERVILRKQLWRQELRSWKAESYTRQNLSNEDGIVSITESFSTTWWDRNRGFREVITGQRQTNNILPGQNFAGSSYLPNFYDDDIRIAGFSVIGVTHPDALRYYDFRLIGERQIDDQRIVDIEVIPKTRLQPVFKGTISVLENEYALIEVDLRPGDAIFFPPPLREVNLSYRQQFNNYGGSFWLPTDVRISGTLEIGVPGFRIPKIIFNQSASILNYEVNIPVPDSLFERSMNLLIDTEVISENRIFDNRAEAIPLTDDEQQAYATIDSTKTLEEAFRPTGILARMAGDGAVQVGSSASAGQRRVSFSPRVHFNRVDAVFIGGEASYPFSSRGRITLNAGYNFGQEDLSYGGRVSYWLGQNRRSFTTISYSNESRERISSRYYSRTITSFGMLAGMPDYFDYYHAERFQISLGHRFRTLGIRPQVFFRYESARSLSKVTSYSISGGYKQRMNPAIDDGTIQAAGIQLRIGDSISTVGITGGTGLTLTAEHSTDAIFRTDFNYSRVMLEADIRLNTFLQRRFLPNTLDIKVKAFISDGELPLQRFGALDGKLVGFSPFGVFRSMQSRQIEGEHGVAMHLEHNFRTVPFELLGIRALVDRSVGILVFTSAGRTWINESISEDTAFSFFYNDGWIYEAGLSVNNVFSFLRIDAVYRIDRPGFFLGFGASKFF